MMIDAIFIQSWHGELNGELSRFLKHLYAVQRVPVPVWVFMDVNSLQDPYYIDVLKLKRKFNVKFKFVDDTRYNNPQTTVFHQLVTHRVEQYKQVLLLESDCQLLPGYFECINADIEKLKDWWIYGSCYYGVGDGRYIQHDDNKLRRNHMNGVAVYNRTSDFINFVNNIYITEGGVNNSHAFDWLFAIRYFNSEYKDAKLLYDSNYIINLSPTWDVNTPFYTRKPLAKIIHQKSIQPS